MNRRNFFAFKTLSPPIGVGLRLTNDPRPHFGMDGVEVLLLKKNRMDFVPVLTIYSFLCSLELLCTDNLKGEFSFSSFPSRLRVLSSPLYRALYFFWEISFLLCPSTRIFSQENI